MIAPWFETTQRVYAEDRKRVYYLSMEFLIGRLLEDAVANLGLDERLREVVECFGVDYAALLADEPMPRSVTAASAAWPPASSSPCRRWAWPPAATAFATRTGCPAVLRAGLAGRGGRGLAAPGPSLGARAPEANFPVHFGGSVRSDGARSTWTPAQTVLAVAYDTPVPGWRGRWSNTLRLWSAKPVREFDLEPFNRGDYMAAAAPSVLAETISRVLYPDDTTEQGRS